MLAAWERLDEFNQAYAELRLLKDGATQAAVYCQHFLVDSVNTNPCI